MFGKDASDADGGGQPRREKMTRTGGLEERRVAAWIGASIVIEGDLTSSEDLTIAGEVHGDVRVPKNTLVIAPQARIRGSIIAHHVAVQGTVRGSITADGAVEVTETGSVDGDIRSPRMTVAEGAALQGRLRIEDPARGRS